MAAAMALELRYLVYSAVLCWFMIILASFLRGRGWTPRGSWVLLGNRENMPDPSPLAGRADRAAKNMLENLVLFGAVVTAAYLAGERGGWVVLGARISSGRASCTSSSTSPASRTCARRRGA